MLSPGTGLLVNPWGDHPQGSRVPPGSQGPPTLRARYLGTQMPHVPVPQRVHAAGRPRSGVRRALARRH